MAKHKQDKFWRAGLAMAVLLLLWHAKQATGEVFSEFDSCQDARGVFAHFAALDPKGELGIVVLIFSGLAAWATAATLIVEGLLGIMPGRVKTWIANRQFRNAGRANRPTAAVTKNRRPRQKSVG